MSVLTSEKNTEALSLTFVAEFDADVDRVWQVWEDPRKLERWWGPPTYPATFERHDFVVGGESHYYMTSPEGEKMRGWWQITAIDAPHRIEFDDGFADADGSRSTAIDAIHATVTLDAFDGGTRMTVHSTFTSAEQLEQMVKMGMEEGMRQAIGQIEAVLRSETASA